MFKRVIDALYNPVDAKLKRLAKEGKNKILVIWNRGLGDIPLGLCAFVRRARELVPHAEITFATRPDLADVFAMLDNVSVLVCTNMKRGEPTPELPLEPYDLVFHKLDPTRHLSWQLGTFTPSLAWDPTRDALANAFALEPDVPYLAAHVNTETGQYYGYEKNWPEEKWHALFEKTSVPVVLFGMKSDNKYPYCIDLRGKTSLFGMLSLIKNRCRYLVAPDSGILSILYYLESNFPCRAVSLWADPKQGILRQNVDSPNELLRHTALIGADGDVGNIEVDTVHEALFAQSE